MCFSAVLDAWGASMLNVNQTPEARPILCILRGSVPALEWFALRGSAAPLENPAPGQLRPSGGHATIAESSALAKYPSVVAQCPSSFSNVLRSWRRGPGPSRDLH
ncbi:unnamed protein product [Durusdinium trenchii]|uniref:Uncharacterized protein n=1 Tax=Durusdinium trenchii TaxID=1381693 RepID=A0ABP0M9D3_9DINO